MAYRVLALALIVTVSASPTLAAICESMCAALPVTAAAHGCHERSAPDASPRLVAAVHTCGHDGLLPRASGTRAEQPLQMSITDVEMVAPVMLLVEPAIPLPPGAGPPDFRSHVTPLRI